MGQEGLVISALRDVVTLCLITICVGDDNKRGVVQLTHIENTQWTKEFTPYFKTHSGEKSEAYKSVCGLNHSTM